jgi:hypothetical protein
MPGWQKRFGGQYQHALQVNPKARPHWKTADEFFFDKSTGADPAQSIRDLFTPSKRFDERNFLLCDHVIHTLHLESLVRVKSKRDGNSAWLKAITDAQPEGWLRITFPNLRSGHPVFLGGDFESRFFVHETVYASDLMVGDHVIIYNHPAYDVAKERVDVWRMENALVVATSPRLLLQGHGTEPLPFTSTRKIPVKDKLTDEPSMRFNMLTLFNNKLKKLRAAAEAENAKRSPRAEIDDFDSEARLVLRTDVGPYSGFDPKGFTPDAARKARWWIRWAHDAEHFEDTIAADDVWAREAWNTSRVEITANASFFPLWLPRRNGKGELYLQGGKISVLEEVFASPQMAAGWDWYYEKGESIDIEAPHRLVARRPVVS